MYQCLNPLRCPPAYLNARSPSARCRGCRLCNWLEGSPPAASTWCWPRGRFGVRPASRSAAPNTESRDIYKACSADQEDKSSCGLHLMLTTGKIWGKHHTAPLLIIESRNVIEACSADKEGKSSCGLCFMLTTEKIWREASIIQCRSWYRK